MSQNLRLLIVEDSEFDATLLILELKKGGYEVIHTRVQTAEEMRRALREDKWDLIISDYTMPRFSAHGALEIAKELAADLPFIVVSGTVSEEVAVEVMRAGAQDFMSKSKLLRLLPAIKRELNEAARRSEHRLIEQQLRQAQKMEAVGQLTGGIAHDFNNLLSVVIGNIEILLDHVTENPQAQALANDALNGALHGAELTRRLLSFSRQAPLSTRIVDINKCLSNLLVMLRRTIGAGIEIKAELSNTLWEAKLDPSQLEDAIVNLAINARDAMPDGGILTIVTRNLAGFESWGGAQGDLAGKDCVLISVQDTGTGMSPDVLERAIEPFFTTKGEGKGTGLGLSMVYGFIKQSGGRLLIESEPGKGTSINMVLPRASQDRASDDDQRLAIAIPRGSETILVVEDNADLRSVVKGLLSGLGYKTIEAEAGNEALAILDGNAEIDLLLTDIGLRGGITGFQLAQQMQARKPSIRVLYTTGYTKSAPENLGDEGERAHVLRKPYRRQDLAQKVREALDDKA